jgi:hypothetical protein
MRNLPNTAKFLALLVGIVAAMAASSPASAATANTFGAEMFGISDGGQMQTEDATSMNRDLDAMAAAGARWLRVDVYWSSVQGAGPDSYDWSGPDRLIKAASARGIKVLAFIGFAPPWARPAGSDQYHAPDAGKYATFAAKTAAHYAPMGVHAYEVWNEPNIGFWQPKPDPVAYTNLLKAAYPAIKSQDPASTVLIGGLSPADSSEGKIPPVDFLKAIYANGGKGYFDAVGHHPYCWPATPGDQETWSAWYQMNQGAESLRSVMVANGDGDKKIWGTEFGAPTNGPSGSFVSEAEQAKAISTGYAKWQTYDWAGPLFAYQARDRGTATDTRENFFGLLRRDFSEKPAYAAYKAAAAAVAAGGAAPTTTSGGTAGTTTTVDAKGKGKGRGKVQGRVLAKGKKAVSGGHVKLRVYGKRHGHWRAASGWRHDKLNAHGRFSRSVKRLRSGRYQVRARYLGGPGTKPSADKSPTFKVAGSH